MAKTKTKRNELPFSETNPEPVKPIVDSIDMAAIEKLAAEIDVINAQEETGPKKRKKKATATGTDSPKDLGEGPEPEPMFTPDPEFQFMISHITSGAIEIAKRKLDWTDPGVQWKEKVGLTVFKLSQRITPMGDSWMTDVATLLGYVGLWSASNVLFTERATPGPDIVGDNGKREDVQNERTLGKGAEGYTL